MNQYLGTDRNATTEEVRNNFALLSHDLRSALSGVLGSLDLIDLTRLADEDRGNLVRARASSRMLQELLDLAFDQSGKTERNAAEAIDVAAELHAVADIWKPQMAAAGTRLSLEIPEALPRLECSDKVSFHRILNNLLGNAHKYAAGGAISLSVRYNGGQTLSIVVRDDGPGFSEAARARLFQFRGRPENAEKPGTGMGLYIVKTLVRGMGGMITARNGETGGAEVTLVFPVADTAVAPVRRADDSLPDLSALNILLAEDNITNQMVVTQMLKTMGARYAVASDGVEVLELFEAGDFDVLLLDIEMPRKSGLEVLRTIRARQDEKAGVPLIALTAYVMRDHRERIERAGADGIIAKPIEGIAALGRSILGFMYGADSPAAPAAAKASTLSGFEGDVGEIDRQVFDTLMKAIGPEIRTDFMDKLRTDLEDMRTALIEAEAAGDMQAMRAASHTLVSVGGSIGAANLQRCAEALNLAVKAEGQANRQSLNMLCIKGISEVLAFLATQ